MIQVAKGPAVQESDAPSAPQCRHHWVIESPHGAVSKGVCKLCKAEREFPNSAQDYLWENETGPTQSSGRWPRGDPRDSFRGEQDLGSTVSYSTWLGFQPEQDDTF